MSAEGIVGKLFWAIFVGGSTLVASVITKPIELGDRNSDCVWVYLCGLTDDFYAPHEVDNRMAFDALGKKLHIKFLALHPPLRCSYLNDCWCWPHHTKEEILATYQYICDQVGDKKIQGFVGFSNGGFLLNQLVQHRELPVPAISVGASGYLHHNSIHNHLYLMISKEDTAHYSDALKYYQMAKGSPLRVQVKKYSGGHIIPFEKLSKVLTKIKGCPRKLLI